MALLRDPDQEPAGEAGGAGVPSTHGGYGEGVGVVQPVGGIPAFLGRDLLRPLAGVLLRLRPPSYRRHLNREGLGMIRTAATATATVRDDIRLS